MVLIFTIFIITGTIFLNKSIHFDKALIFEVARNTYQQYDNNSNLFNGISTAYSI